MKISPRNQVSSFTTKYTEYTKKIKNLGVLVNVVVEKSEWQPNRVITRKMSVEE